MKPWLTLILLAGCEWPVLSLATRTLIDGSVADSAVDARAQEDEDDASDEQPFPCSSAAACPPAGEPERTLCNLTAGYCVECITDNDCPAGERCEDDGDCDD